MSLAKSAAKQLERFYTAGIYDSLVDIEINAKKRLLVRPGLSYAHSELEGIVETENPRKIVFDALPSNNSKVSAIVTPKNWYNRILLEFCKKLPFPDVKNQLYQSLGMQIGNGVTVAPNVYLDFLNPELIAIGNGTIIGEEAMILTHFLYPERYEIGQVKIGRNCVIGARALIHPGICIGDYATIGTNVVVCNDVLSGMVIRPS